MADQNLIPPVTPPALADHGSLSDILKFSQGKSSAPIPPGNGSGSVDLSSIMQFSRGQSNMATNPHVALDDLDSGMETRKAVSNEQEAYDNVAKSGFYMDEHGNKVSTSTLDDASLADKILGDTINGTKLARRTTGAADESINFGNRSGSDIKDSRHSLENIAGFIPGAEKLVGGGFSQKNLKPYTDENGNVTLKEFTPQNEEDYKSVTSAYGPQTFNKNFFYAMGQGFGSLVSGTGSSFLGLAQMSKDLVNPNQNSTIDRIANSLRHSDMMNDNAKDIHSGIFDSLGGFGQNLGSGIASLIQFGVFGNVSEMAVGATKLLKSPEAVELAGRLGGAFIMSAGGAYNEAKEAGLDPRSASVMALSTGVIDAVLQEKIGSNLVAKYLIKGNGGPVINKIIMEEMKQYGGEYTEKNLNKASGNIMKRIFAGIDQFQHTVSEVPILGPTLEGGGQMFAQSLINNTGHMIYNGINEGKPDKIPGHGLYNKLSGNDLFMNAWNEAASAGIMGGLTGAVMQFNKPAEVKNILPFIVAGKVADVHRAIDWMRSEGRITSEQAESYRDRVNKLDDIHNKNKAAFETITDPFKRALVKAKAVDLIDSEFEAKNKVKKQTDILETIRKKRSEDNVSPTTNDSELETQQKQVDIETEKLNDVQKQLKDHMPDENGHIPYDIKSKVRAELEKHFISTHLTTDKDNENYAPSFARHTLKALGGNDYEDQIDSIYKNKKGKVDKEEKDKINGFIAPFKPDIQPQFEQFVKESKEKDIEDKKTFVDKIGDPEKYPDKALADLLANDQLPENQRKAVEDEVNTRKNNANAKKPTYDPTDETNMALAKKTDDNPEFIPNISNSKKYPTPNLENLALHPEISDESKNAIEKELKRRKENGKETNNEAGSKPGQENGGKEGLTPGQDNGQKAPDKKPIQAGSEGGQEDGEQEEEKKLKEAAENGNDGEDPEDENELGTQVLNKKPPVKPQAGGPGPESDPAKKDLKDIQKTERKDNKEVQTTRVSAFFVAFKSLIYKIVGKKTVDDYDKDGKLVQVPHNGKLESPNHYQVGHEVFMRAMTFEEAQATGYKEDEVQFKKDQSSHETMVIGIYDSTPGKNGENEFMGNFPTFKNSETSRKKSPEAADQAIATRKDIFNDYTNGSGRKKLYTSIIDKTAGVLNFNRAKQSIFKALGGGTKLADGVQIGIGKGGELYLSTKAKFRHPLVNGKVENGKIYASVKQANNTKKRVLVPLDVALVGHENAIAILKILQAHFNPKGKLRADLKAGNMFPEIDLNEQKDVMKAIKSILYVQQTKVEEAEVPGDHAFRIYRKNGQTMISLGETDMDQYNIAGLFVSTSHEDVVDQFIHTIANRYRAVHLEDLNKSGTYRSWGHKDGRLYSTEHKSYLHFLDETGVLTTDLQGFPKEPGSNDYNFTSGPVVQLEGSTYTTSKLKKSEGEATAAQKEADSIVEPVIVPAQRTKAELSLEEKLKKRFGPDMTIEKFKAQQKAPNKSIDFSLSPDEEELHEAIVNEHKDNVETNDKLFVKAGTFSVNQQQSIISGIIGEICRLVNYEGVKNKTELFNRTRDFFEETRDIFRELSEVEGDDFDRQAKAYDKILEPGTYGRFEQFAEAQLNRMGIEFKSNSLEYNDNKTTNEEEHDDPLKTDTEIDSANATHDRTQYEDSYQFSDSALNKTSAKLRSILSFIPDSQWVINDEGELELKEIRNGYELTTTIPVSIIWNKLLSVVYDLKQGEIMSKLKELGENDPIFAQIYNLIENHPDENIKNEFQVLLYKQQAGFIALLAGKEDKDGTRVLKTMSPNRTNAHDIVFKDWVESLKMNQHLVKVTPEGNRYIDTTEGKRIKKAYDDSIAGLDFKKDATKALTAIAQALSDIGIDVTEPFLNHLYNHGLNFQGTKMSLATLAKDKFSQILLSRLAGQGRGSGDSNDGDGELFDAHNPFLQEGNFMKALANVEAAANTQIYETSFLGGDGKARYSFVNNSYLSNFFKSVMSDDSKIVDNLRLMPYSADSMWLADFDTELKQGFKLEYFDTIGVQGSSTKNKLMKNMSEAEKEWARAGLYQNNNVDGFSKYFIPIPGDKTMIPVITARRIPVSIMIEGIKRLVNTESKAMDHLFNVFKSEHARISKVQEIIEAELKNPPTTSHQIAGYHFGEEGSIGDRKGMGEKFLGYTMFNGDEEVFNKDGSIRPINEEYVKEKIQEFFDKEIRKQEDIWIRLDMVNTKEPRKSLLFDKRFHKDGKTDQLIPKFAGEYVVNQFLFNFNYTQIIGGDPALHGKGDVRSTWINYNKRMVKDMAPGLDPMFTKSTTFNAIFLKDIKGASEYASKYAKLLAESMGKAASDTAYQKMNLTDAQEYTTLQEHLDVMEAMGQLSPAIRMAADRLQKGGSNPQDISAILGPMKPVYVGDKFDFEMGVARKYYLKTSAFPLIPGLVRGTPLDALRIHMENHVDENGNSDPIQRAIYESGVKLGLENSSLPMNEKGSTDMTVGDLSQTYVHQLNREGFRIQQDIPYHGPSHATEGTQVRRLINANMEEGETLFTMGATRTRNEAFDIFEGLHAQKINLSWEELSKTLGIGTRDKTGISYKINDVAAFKKILMDEAVSRGYAVNEMIGLNLVTNPKTGETFFKIPLAFNAATTKFEAIMNSVFNNRILKQDLPGNTYVQGSGAGFKFTSKLSDSVKNDIVHVDESRKDIPLQFFDNSTKDGAGRNQVAECYIPSFFKNAAGETIDLRNIDMKNIPDELLYLFGYRIPTQGLNSIMVFKVKGFLPGYMGDLVIVPSEITEQMGSDFDVDKMFMHHFNYTEANGVFTKVENLTEDELKNIPSVKDKLRLENTILQHYMDRFHYADDKTAGQIVETNGYGNLKQLNKEITALTEAGKEDDNYLLARTQNDFHARNIDGLAGKGIFSLYSVFHQLGIMAGLKLGSTIGFRIGEEDFKREGFQVKNVHGGYSSSVISYLQSASVDNAKLQYLSGLNINPHTMGVAGLIASAGFNEDHIAYFLSQPILRDYTKILSSLRDLTNTTFDPKKQSKAVDKLVAKYSEGLEKPISDGFYDRVRLNQHVPKKLYSLEEMKAELDPTGKPNPQTQIDMLANFIRYKEQSMAVDKIISATNIIKGVGANFLQFETKLHNIDNLDFNKSPIEGKAERVNPLTVVDNVENIFKPETIIGKATALARKFFSSIANFFPYSNKAYDRIKKTLNIQSNIEVELREDYLKHLYSHLNSFILSNTGLIDGEEIQTLRDRLMYDGPGNKSLGTRIKEERSRNKDNALLQRLEVVSGVNSNDPTEINAINTPSQVKSDNVDAALMAFSTMSKGTDEQKAIAKDLIKYFLTTGGAFNPTSISRYIPLDQLEAVKTKGDSPYSAKLRKQIEATANNGEFFNKFMTQYYRHNPEKAYKIAKDASTIKTVDFQDNKIIVSQYNKSLRFIKGIDHDGMATESYPSYISMFDPKTKSHKLFILTEVNGNKDRIYKRINLLGKANFTEYNFNETDGNTKSTLSQNRIAGLNPTEVIQDSPIRKDDPINDRKEKENVDIDGLRNNMGMDEGKPTRAIDVLDRLIDKDTTAPGLKTLIKDLRQIISPDVMVNELSMVERINGWYDHNDKSVNVNMNEFLQSETPTRLATETLIHEMLHAITKNQFENIDGLNPKQLEAYQRIKKIYEMQLSKAKKGGMFDAAGNRLTENGFTRFLDIAARKTKNAEIARIAKSEGVEVNKDDLAVISKEDHRHFKDNFDRYYPLTSMDEMVAGLSNSTFANGLRSGTKGENWWKAVFSHAMDFLGLNFKNDWEALHHSVLALNDHQSDYKYGWDNANRIVSNDSDIAELKEDMANNNSEWSSPAIGFGNVRSEDQDPNMTPDEANFSMSKHLDTPETAILRINNAFKGNGTGLLPKATDSVDVQREVQKYNDAVGYEALKLKRSEEGSLSVVKTPAAMFSLSKGADEEGVKKTPHEKLTAKLVAKLRADNGKLAARLNETSDKNRVLGIMAFNSKQITKLLETDRLTQVVDVAKKHMDMAYFQIKNNVSDINQLNEIQSVVHIFSGIDDNIQFNKANDEYNKKVKDIISYGETITKAINKQKFDLLVEDLHKSLDLPATTDYDKILTGIKTDVGSSRSLFLTASRSKSMFIRLGGAMMAKAKLRITAEYKQYEHHVYKLFTDFLENGNKDYDILLQHDKNGKRTGKLLNEYTSEYDDAIREATKNKKRKEFLRDNMDVVIPAEGQKMYDKDLALVKANHPDWDIADTNDNSKYLAFVKFNDPKGYVDAIKAAEQPTQIHATKYIQESPKAKWRDPKYDELMRKGVDTPEVRLFTLVRNEFNDMNLKYSGRHSMNRIPEIAKSLIGFITDRNFKGAFHMVADGFVNSFKSNIDPIIKAGNLDEETGKPHNSIPVYMMSNFLDAADKTYDLKRVLLTAKMQDISIAHKQRIEPYLLHMQKILAESRAYMLNNANQPQSIFDEDGNAQTVVVKNSGLENTQAQFGYMMDEFLYNKGSKSVGVMAPDATRTNSMDENSEKGLDENGDFQGPKQSRYFTMSRASDAVNSLTRSTGLIFNVPAAINNVTFGFSSNFAYAAGGGSEVNLGDAFKASAIILGRLAVGSPMATKIKLFMEKFGIDNQLNEVKFNRIKGKDVENPLANVNLHWMSEEGEKMIQGHLGIAMALHQKVGSSNAFDGYDVVNGELKWNTDHGPDPFADEDKLNKFCASIKNAVFQNHGNYEEPIQFKKEWYGRLLMTYKTWIPELMLSKFGSETIGLDGTLEKGQLISVADILKGPDGVRSAQATATNLYSLISRDPTLGSLKEIDRINIKRSIASLVMTVGLMSGALALRAGMMGEDDKNKKAKLIFLMNLANRNVQDMSFFYNPSSFTQLFASPIPAIGTLKNIIAIVPALANAITGNDTITKGVYRNQSRLGRALIKATPILNAGQKIEIASRQTFSGN